MHKPDEHEAYQYFAANNIDNSSSSLQLHISDEQEFRFLEFAPNVKELYIAGIFDFKMSDTSIELLVNSLKKKDSLEKLVICKGANFSETGMKYLGKLTSLKSLSIDNPLIESGFEHLTKLQSLKELFLTYSKRPLSPENTISDTAIDAITALKKIRLLDLEGTRVTDAGANKLKSLPKLEYINLNNTDVTEEKKQELEELCVRNCDKLFESPATEYSPTNDPNVYEQIDYSSPDEQGYFNIATGFFPEGFTVIKGLPSQKRSQES